ncbi:RNA polymerase sigma factor [Sutcliffiella horikoshii]|uniref:RNA polymerase sigma factor n=1 Tax=Sutcliffiella horikoshii TaxID=79883 RepID=UPI003CF7DE25
MNYVKIEELIKDYKQGEPVDNELYGMFEQLFKLYLYIKPYYTKKTDLEDVKMAFLLNCFEAIFTFDKSKSNIRTYFLSIYKNTFFEKITHEQRMKRNPNKEVFSMDAYVTGKDEHTSRSIIEFVNQEEQEGLNPLWILEEMEEQQELKKILNQLLSECEITCLHLIYIAGMTYEEITDAIGLSEKQIDNAVQRAKKKIKEHLERSDRGIHIIKKFPHKKKRKKVDNGVHKMSSLVYI